MGNPKFPRRKYDTPSHPWQGERIKMENDIINKFGLKNKREVWKSQSFLRNLRHQARSLNARLRMADIQAEKEKDQLLAKLTSQGLLMPNSNLNDVLSLELESILNRRLQTQVYLKGLAHSPGQARQFIVHGHISIADRKVTIPGYFVKHDEEERIEYNSFSPLVNELHPMRPKAKAEITVEGGDGQVSRLISLETSETEEEKSDKDKKEKGEKKADDKESDEAPDSVVETKDEKSESKSEPEASAPSSEENKSETDKKPDDKGSADSSATNEEPKEETK
jgi:small subunit ribosomal protein S4